MEIVSIGIIIGIAAGIFTIIGVYVQIKEYREKQESKKNEVANKKFPSSPDAEVKTEKEIGIKTELKLKEKLESAEKSTSFGEFSEISLALGELHYSKGELDEAEKYFQNARSYFLEISDYNNLSRALIGLASVYTASGNHESAISASLEAEAISNDPVILMEAKLRLGTCHRRLGNYSEALTELNSSLETSKKISNQTFTGEISLAIGDVFWKLNKWDEAERNYRESIDILTTELYSHPSNDLARFHLAQAKYATGRVYLENQRYKESEKLLKDSFQTLEKIGNFFGIEMCAQLLGRLYERTGNLRKSRQWYHESFIATYMTGNELRLVETLFFMAQLAQKMDDSKRAQILASSAANKAEEHNLFEQYAQLLLLLGNISCDASVTDTAIESYKNSILAALRVSPNVIDSIFYNLSDRFQYMGEVGQKSLATHIVQELMQWWPIAIIDGVKATDFEKEKILKSNLDRIPQKISVHLLGLHDVIIN